MGCPHARPCIPALPPAEAASPCVQPVARPWLRPRLRGVVLLVQESYRVLCGPSDLGLAEETARPEHVVCPCSACLSACCS